MLSKNMRIIYKRLMILGVLSICLFVFGYSDETEKIQAAVCMQDCETSQFMCNDSCATSCASTSTSADCTSCIHSCRNSFNNCGRHAIYCTGGTSQPGRCGVNFGRHCVLMPGGTYSCDPANGAYDAYYLTCTNLGGGSCVSCPESRFCQGTDGTPPCF